jgi:hypothetical protein
LTQSNFQTKSFGALTLSALPFQLQMEGWWTYELCYQKQLRQFHAEGKNIVAEFSLGFYDPNVSKATLAPASLASATTPLAKKVGSLLQYSSNNHKQTRKQKMLSQSK